MPNKKIILSLEEKETLAEVDLVIIGDRLESGLSLTIGQLRFLKKFSSYSGLAKEDRKRLKVVLIRWGNLGVKAIA